MKTILKILVAVIVIAAGLAALWLLLRTYASARVGLMGGLGLGILFAPARLAGVDFRQWFRDPGSPSEIGDDTYFGLVRSACHLLSTGALVALLGLCVTASRWASDVHLPVDASVLQWFGYALLGAAIVGVGVLAGVAVVQAVVEAA